METKIKNVILFTITTKQLRYKSCKTWAGFKLR